MRDQGVKKRQQRVDSVTRRTPTPSVEAHGRTINADHAVKHAEISLRSLALIPPQQIQVGIFRLQLVSDSFQALVGMRQSGLLIVLQLVAMVTQGTPQYHALVMQLSQEEISHNGRTALRIVTDPILLTTQ